MVSMEPEAATLADGQPLPYVFRCAWGGTSREARGCDSLHVVAPPPRSDSAQLLPLFAETNHSTLQHHVPRKNGSVKQALPTLDGVLYTLHACAAAGYD